MSYKDLLEALQELDSEQLEDKIVAVVDEECYPVISFEIQNGSEGVVKDGCYYLQVE